MYNKFGSFFGLALLFTLASSPMPTLAHHSFAAIYNDTTISVEGTVRDFRFVNPHVRITFESTDSNGVSQEWITEGSSATGMRRSGWNKTTISAGDYIRVTGKSTRNGSPMVSMDEIFLVNPATGVASDPTGNSTTEDTMVKNMPLQLANGLPNLSSAWTGEATGRIGGPHEAMTPLPYTKEAAQRQANYDPINDPQVQCQPPGLVRQAGFTPHPVRIEQHEDHVVLSYEEYGGIRRVYFDDRDLIGGEHSHLGQSIARYGGQSLIIETTHLLSNLVGTTGHLLSDQTNTIETYYRADKEDGRAALKMDMAISDPGHLTAPWSIHWGKFATANHVFIAVDCYEPMAY